MSPLLGPILAQLVTLAVSDRTEARYVRTDVPYTEAATYPRLGVTLGWKHSSFSLGYGPSITLTPLGSKDREFVVFQNASLSAVTSWQRTTLTLSESFGYGQVNFREQALAGAAAQPGALPATPAAGTPTPGVAPAPTPAPAPGTTNPTQNTLRAPDRIISYFVSQTNVTVNNAVSAALTVGGGLGYTVTGSIKGDSATYPVSKGPLAEAHASYRFTRRDSATTMLTSQYALSSTGNNAWFLMGNESWGHNFSTRTSTQVGTGLSITRNSQTDGLVFWSIFPTFNASVSHVVPEGRSAFSFGSAVSSAPFIDPIRATVDPRITFSGSAGWGLDRFSIAANGGSAVSISQQNDNGAFNSLYASLSSGFRLGAGFSADTGVRAFWQSIAGRTSAPAAYAAFVGLSFGIAKPLGH